MAVSPTPARPTCCGWACRRSQGAGRPAARRRSTHAHPGLREGNRPFSPHLTLGRVNKTFARGAAAASDLIAKTQVAQLGTVPAHEVILFESDLLPGGAVYTALARVLAAPRWSRGPRVGGRAGFAECLDRTHCWQPCSMISTDNPIRIECLPRDLLTGQPSSPRSRRLRLRWIRPRGSFLPGGACSVPCAPPRAARRSLCRG